MATVTGRMTRSRESRFHLVMAVVFVLIAFGGFTPTFWLRIAHGSFHAPPVIYLHGALLFSWTLYYLSQAWLVAVGRTPDHRSWGLLGISLFTLVICSILAGQMAMMRADAAQGYLDARLRFSSVSLVGLVVLIVLFGTAIVNIRRPEIHRRLMYLMMTSFMVPAIARVFIVMLAPASGAAGPAPPPFVAVPPAMVALLLVVVGMVHDKRTHGRIHPAYIYGGLFLLAEDLLVVPFASTPLWMSIARGFYALGG